MGEYFSCWVKGNSWEDSWKHFKKNFRKHQRQSIIKSVLWQYQHNIFKVWFHWWPYSTNKKKITKLWANILWKGEIQKRAKYNTRHTKRTLLGHILFSPVPPVMQKVQKVEKYNSVETVNTQNGYETISEKWTDKRKTSLCLKVFRLQDSKFKIVQNDLYI